MKQLEKVKEALEFYAEGKNFTTSTPEETAFREDYLNDWGGVAKEALAELNEFRKKKEWEKDELEKLLEAMRCGVKFTNKATMPITLYKRIKSAINVIKGE